MRKIQKIVTILVLLSFSQISLGSDRNVREGRFELSVYLADTGSEKLSGEGGASLDLDGDTGFGFTFGYHFNENFLLSFDFMTTEPDYLAITGTQTEQDQRTAISHYMKINQSQLNATYHFGQNALTPFISAGIGWTYIDSNVQSGPPSGTCWFDPFWWTYICDEFVPTYDDTNFSYNLGAGLRYDFTSNFFIRGAYNMNFSEIGEDQSFDISAVKLDVGYVF